MGGFRFSAVIALVVLMCGATWADWPELRTRDPKRQEPLKAKLALIPKTHPRIFIHSDADLDPVRERIKSNPEVAEAYAALRDWAYSGEWTDGGWQPTLQLQARTVVYRLEKRDPKLLEPIVKQADWLCANDLDEWSWSWIARSLAFVYDWCYDDLTPEQREKYARRAIQCTKTVYGLWEQAPTNNHVYLKQGMVIYPGLAFYGDGIDDAAAEQMVLDNLELLFSLFIPVHNVLNAGDGGWQESMSYHSMFTFEFAHLIEAWQSASGEDVWKSFSGLDSDAQFCLYCREPFNNAKINVADGHGNAVDRQISYYIPLLVSRRHDGVARYWSDWIREHSRQTDSAGKTTLKGPHMWWPFVLWYDPTMPTVKPEALPLARIFRGIGYVVGLSGWEKDAVFSMFICAPWWCGGHQHLDANSFILSRYAPLAIDSGVRAYDITRANYYARTIAHNTVTVYDPKEKFIGGTWGHSPEEAVANDGGHAYGGGASMPEDFVEDGPDNRGRILAFLHTPEYTYVVGDATRCFVGGGDGFVIPLKVKEHQRAFLHVQPDLFIVFDRVEATDPNFKKRWLLHTEAKPQVAGARQPDAGASLTVKNGDGVLSCTTLLPVDPEVVVVEPMVLADRSAVPKVDVAAYPPGYPNQWRIEISPKSASARDYFLHVLSTPAKGVDERPQATAEDTADAATVTVKWAGRTVKVRFPKTGALVGHLTITGADGKTVVDEDLPQKVQTNADLLQSTPGK
jgi:heparin/heparan-sulfate lyase